jgi:hypothetical protein
MTAWQMQDACRRRSGTLRPGQSPGCSAETASACDWPWCSESAQLATLSRRSAIHEVDHMYCLPGVGQRQIQDRPGRIPSGLGIPTRVPARGRLARRRGRGRRSAAGSCAPRRPHPTALRLEKVAGYLHAGHPPRSRSGVRPNHPGQAGWRRARTAEPDGSCCHPPHGGGPRTKSSTRTMR